MKHLRLFGAVVVAIMLLSMMAACAQPTPVPTQAPAAQPAATEAPKATEVPAPPSIGVVKVGTNAEYPPFESVDENGKIVGFDPDIIAAIAKASGFEVELINTRWDGIFVALASKEFDAVASAATITDERKQSVDFSDPYFNAGQMIAVKAGSAIATVADLDGKKVGVQLGTTGDIWLSDNTKAEVVRYDEITLAFQALGNGDIDAIVNDGPTSADIIKANPELGVTLVGEPFTDEFYGIAIQKDRPELVAAINQGLAAIKASGEYDQIYEKWFGIPEATEAATGAEPSRTSTKYEAENCDYGGELKSIEAIDDNTVKFTLCTSDVAFPSKVAFSAFAIHSSDYLQETGGGGELIEAPIGTGPYMLEKWVKGDSIIMKRNPDYWGTPAKTESLVFRWSKEGAARLLELQAGTVDGIDNPTPDDFPTIEGDANLKLYPREALNIFYIGLNVDKPPLDNALVRKALAMGIDRARIVDNFYVAGSTVASHFSPCAIPGGCVGDEWYEYDPEQAKALLAEAGFPNGFEIELAYRDVFRSYLPEPAVVAQDIQAQLKDLGITAKIVVMESGAFIDASDAGELTMYLLGWNADFPDQTNFLDFHFGKGASKQFGAGFPDIWEKLDEAGSLAEQEARNVIYAEANDLIKEHIPMVPVAHGGSATAFKADVVGAHASPLGNEYFAVVDPGGRTSLVWMQNAEPIGLYCADESDGESLRACEQMNESLLSFQVGGVAVEPALAESYESNDDLTEWVFHLRKGVKFHDGSEFTAEDVVVSYAVQWDAQHPLHVGRDGSFTYFPGLLGQFLNAPE